MYCAQIPQCSGPDSHNEQTPALKVPLQTELRFHPRRYEQPHTLEGQIATAMTSGQTLLQQGPRPRPHSRGEDKLSKPKSRRPGSQMAAAISSATRTSLATTTLEPGGGVHLPTNTAPAGAGRPKVHRQVLTPVLATKTRMGLS
jgi:hypothetical protein